MDPLQMLQAAGTVPPNSKEQSELLTTLRQTLEQRPAPIPILVGTLLPGVAHAGDSLMKYWVIDLLYFAICRANLTPEQKTQS
jgi:symplekin